LPAPSCNELATQVRLAIQAELRLADRRFRTIRLTTEDVFRVAAVDVDLLPGEFVCLAAYSAVGDTARINKYICWDPVNSWAYFNSPAECLGLLRGAAQ